MVNDSDCSLLDDTLSINQHRWQKEIIFYHIFSMRKLWDLCAIISRCNYMALIRLYHSQYLHPFPSLRNTEMVLEPDYRLNGTIFDRGNIFATITIIWTHIDNYTEIHCHFGLWRCTFAWSTFLVFKYSVIYSNHFLYRFVAYQYEPYRSFLHHDTLILFFMDKIVYYPHTTRIFLLTNRLFRLTSVDDSNFTNFCVFVMHYIFVNWIVVLI